MKKGLIFLDIENFMRSLETTYGIRLSNYQWNGVWKRIAEIATNHCGDFSFKGFVSAARNEISIDDLGHAGIRDFITFVQAGRGPDAADNKLIQLARRTITKDTKWVWIIAGDRYVVKEISSIAKQKCNCAVSVSGVIGFPPSMGTVSFSILSSSELQFKSVEEEFGDVSGLKGINAIRNEIGIACLTLRICSNRDARSYGLYRGYPIQIAKPSVEKQPELELREYDKHWFGHKYNPIRECLKRASKASYLIEANDLKGRGHSDEAIAGYRVNEEFDSGTAYFLSKVYKLVESCLECDANGPFTFKAISQSLRTVANSRITLLEWQWLVAICVYERLLLNAKCDEKSTCYKLNKDHPIVTDRLLEDWNLTDVPLISQLEKTSDELQAIPSRIESLEYQLHQLKGNLAQDYESDIESVKVEIDATKQRESQLESLRETLREIVAAEKETHGQSHLKYWIALTILVVAIAGFVAYFMTSKDSIPSIACEPSAELPMLQTGSHPILLLTDSTNDQLRPLIVESLSAIGLETRDPRVLGATANETIAEARAFSCDAWATLGNQFNSQIIMIPIVSLDNMEPNSQGMPRAQATIQLTAFATFSGRELVNLTNERTIIQASFTLDAARNEVIKIGMELLLPQLTSSLATYYNIEQ